MTTVNYTSQGFIFVNELGQYAVSNVCVVGFAPPRDVINWVSDINMAEVFPHEAMARRKFKALEKCQSLKAVATREVMIRNWEA